MNLVEITYRSSIRFRLPKSLIHLICLIVHLSMWAFIAIAFAVRINLRVSNSISEFRIKAKNLFKKLFVIIKIKKKKIQCLSNIEYFTIHFRNILIIFASSTYCNGQQTLISTYSLGSTATRREFVASLIFSTNSKWSNLTKKHIHTVLYNYILWFLSFSCHKR